jgi:hypothetical protein
MFFGWNAEKYNIYRKEVSKIAKDSEELREVYRVLSLIDTKASALLTHVSIMIAVCAFFHDRFRGDSIIEKVLLFEAILYIFASMLLLFSIDYYRPGVSLDNATYIQRMSKTSLFRKNFYKIAHSVALISTILLIATISFQVIRS